MFDSKITSNDSLPLEWNEEQNNELAKKGILEYHEDVDHLNRRSIFIEKRQSSNAGFGTASTRKIVTISMEKGFGGHFHNEACYKSHLFHLYMGMIPQDRTISVFEHNWGKIATMALQQLPDIKVKITNHESLSPQEISTLNRLKKILIDNTKKETQPEIESETEIEQEPEAEIESEIETESEAEIEQEMSDETFIAREGELLSLAQEEGSYLKLSFIPDLLEILNENSTVHRPDTTILCAVKMYLSEEGLERWKTAITNKKPFRLFKKLEHLRPFMDANQLNELDRIMTIREKLFSHN